MLGSFMLDTTVFNHVLGGMITVAKDPTARLIITDVQADEIRNTTDPGRRAALLQVLEAIDPVREQTSVFVWGASSWSGGGRGGGMWGDGAMYDRVRAALDAKDEEQGKKKRSAPDGVAPNVRDAMIAATSIALGTALVTGDTTLAEVVRALGGRVATPDEVPGMTVVPRC